MNVRILVALACVGASSQCGKSSNSDTSGSGAQGPATRSMTATDTATPELDPTPADSDTSLEVVVRANVLDIVEPVEIAAPGLPVQEPSSFLPCLCWPDGHDCTAIGFSHAAIPPDESLRCPSDERCDGGIGILGEAKLGRGKCRKLCYMPGAEVTADLACSPGEFCGFRKIIGDLADEYHVYATAALCQPIVPGDPGPSPSEPYDK